MRLTYADIKTLADSGAYGGERALSALTCALLLSTLATYTEQYWQWTDSGSSWDEIEATVSRATHEIMEYVEQIGEGELDIAIIRDEKSQGTPGGTYTSGSYRQREINTIAYDPEDFVDIAGNAFTVPIGEYLIFARAPAYRIGECNLRLWDSTEGEEVANGASNYASNSAAYHVICTLLEVVEALVETTYSLSMLGETTQSTNGMGKEGNGAIEIFTEVLIVRLT